MKKKISVTAFLFAALLTSCEKNTSSIQEAEVATVNSSQKTICYTSNPKQQDCDKAFAPVCGCNSVTYASACEASNAGLLKWVSGTCDDNGGGYPGDGINR